MKCLLLHLLLLAGLVLAACGGEEQHAPPALPSGTGQPRTFAMGLSSFPPELTEESYASAFELAASVGEVILIRRTPPWDELLTDAPFPSDCTAANTQREIELAAEHGLDIFLAIDVADFSGGCNQEATLPAELANAGFANERVRQALVTYAQYVALNYRPTYLAFGVDVNTFAEEGSEDFDQFLSIYNEAYDAVKGLSPETLVFPTFQLERLDASLPPEGPRQPQWYLIPRFGTRLDLLAVSSYPSLAFSDVKKIPADHYLQLAAHTDRPVVIADMGYSSGPGPDGAHEGSEEQQAAFLRRALRDAQRLAMPLVVWFIGQDTSFAGEPPFEHLQHLGLLRQDGTAKAAWRAWEEAARRPLVERPGRTPASQ